MSSIFVVLYPDRQWKAERLYVKYSHFDTAVPQPETNQHFLGKFTATSHSAAAVYRSIINNYPTRDIVVETNVHFLGRFSPTAHQIPFGFYQHTDTQVPQPETNVHMLGRFTPTLHTILRAHFQTYYPNIDILTESGANPHFIGRFSAVQHLLSWPRNSLDTAVPQPETNVNFLGKYTDTTHKQFRFGHLDTAVPQPEVPVHFIGRFTPTQHNVLPAFRFPVPAGVPLLFQPETNTNFIGKYTAIIYARFPYNVNRDPIDLNPETNPHWLGRFTAVVYSRFQYNPNRDVTDLNSETAVSFLGRFLPIAHQRTLIQSTDVGQTLFVQPETNVSFVGRFTPQTYSRVFGLFQWLEVELNVETASSFIGRYTGTVYTIPIALRTTPPESAETTSETNVHTIGIYTPTVHAVLRSSFYTTFTSEIAVETNPHFIGKFTDVAIRVLTQLRQPEPQEIFTPPIVETNTQSIGRFTATSHRTLLSYRQNYPSTDLVAATNTHWLGRFSPVTHPSIIRNISKFGEGAIPDAPPPFIGRYTATKHTVLRAAIQNNSAFDFAVPETNQHWLGTFIATTYNIQIHLRQTVGAEHPPTETHWIGRYSAPVFSRPIGLLPDLSSGTLESNVSFLGRHTATVYARRAPTESEQPPPQSTPTYSLGRFTAVRHAVPLRLRQSESLDSTDTNPHLIGRFNPVVHAIRAQLRWNQDSVLVPPQQIERGSDWIGRYLAVSYARVRFNTYDTSISQAETTSNWLGRFTEVRHRQLRLAPTEAAVVQEANNHWVGRYAPVVHKIMPALRSNIVADALNPQTPLEENPHWIGRFQPTQHGMFKLNSLEEAIPEVPPEPWLRELRTDMFSTLGALG